MLVKVIKSAILETENKKFTEKITPIIMPLNIDALKIFGCIISIYDLKHKSTKKLLQLKALTCLMVQKYESDSIF